MYVPSGCNSFFCARWLRLLFGREFQFVDTLTLWDAIFADSCPPGLATDASKEFWRIFLIFCIESIADFGTLKINTVTWVGKI